MTPGTRVRIHYPGRPYHGQLGTVAKVRRPGRTYNQYLVEFDAPIQFGTITLARQSFIRQRLHKLPAPPPVDNVVRWRGAMPEPVRAEFVEGEASPVVVAVSGWKVVGGGE